MGERRSKPVCRNLKSKSRRHGKQARIDRGDDVIVGVKKYRLKVEDDIDILDIDNVAVRESQIKRLADIRGKRDEKAVEDALEAIYQCAVCSPCRQQRRQFARSGR